MQLLISLSVVVALALVASSRSFWSLRRTAVGAVIFSGGWVAVGLGLLLSLDRLALVRSGQVSALEPLVHFALGWVGLMVGLQLRRDLPKYLPGALLRLMAMDLGLALFAGVGIWLAAGWLLDLPMGHPLRWFIAAFLGVCMIGWAAEVRSLRRQPAQDADSERLVRATSGLSSVFALLLYGMLFFLFDTPAGAAVGADAARSMGTVIAPQRILFGLSISILIAAAAGWLCHWLMRLAGRNEGHFLVVLLGVVALIAGAAEAMGEPPLLVGMLCGAVLVNLPGDPVVRLKRVLLEAEQPMAMAIMLVAGLMADPVLPGMAWAVVGGVILLRIAIKWKLIGDRIARTAPAGESALFHLAPLRQHPLAMAMAVGMVITHPIDHAAVTGRELLMMVIAIGLVCDLVILLGKWRGATATEQDSGGLVG